MGHGVLFTLVLVFGSSRPFVNKYVSERKHRKKHNVMYESQCGWGPIHWWRLLKRNRSGYTLGNDVFTRVRRGAFVGCWPEANMSLAEGWRSEKKPLAQSALIYCARWTLTLSLPCQSNRRFPTVITCTSTRMESQIWILLQYLSQLSVQMAQNGFRRSQNNSREKGPSLN